jgi:hypothetical protein
MFRLPSLADRRRHTRQGGGRSANQIARLLFRPQERDVEPAPHQAVGEDWGILARDRELYIGKFFAKDAYSFGQPIYFIPRKGVDMALLERTDHATYCPYKGDCAYFSIPLGGNRSTNAVWSYEAPYAPVAQIKDYLAFYLDRVDAIEERPEA